MTGVQTCALPIWIPLFELLESRGFTVLLVNARHVKNVSGRKSDVLDCQWTRPGGGLDQATRADSVYLLQGGDEDRAHANRGVNCRRPADPACGSGGQLIM